MPDERARAEFKAAFLCECGASLCNSRVSMSGAEYRAGSGPVLADGHGPDGGSLGKCSVCGRPSRTKRRSRR
jgi:hypothetical protein